MVEFVPQNLKSTLFLFPETGTTTNLEHLLDLIICASEIGALHSIERVLSEYDRNKYFFNVQLVKLLSWAIEQIRTGTKY